MSPLWIRLFVGAGVLSSLGLGILAFGVIPNLDPIMLGLFFPLELESKLRDATRIEAVLVGGFGHARPPGLEQGIVRRLRSFNLEPRSSPVTLSPEQARRLTTLVLTEGNYSKEDPACCHHTVLVYLAESEHGESEVLVSHDCDRVLMHGGDEQVWTGVDPAARQLEALSHELFPADPEITRLWRAGQGGLSAAATP